MIFKYLDIKLAKMLGLNPKSPAVVHLEITRKCNLRCRMCDLWLDKTNELSAGKLKDIAAELGKAGVKAVGITGGEPMLRNDIEEIIKEFKKKHMIVHLNTNGTIPKTAERLKDTGVDSVTVSIDYFGKEHDENRGMKGCFDKAVQTIRDLKKAGIKRVGIGTLIMGQDAKHFEKLTELANKLNVFISFAGFDLGLVSKQKELRKEKFEQFEKGVEKINELRRKYKNIMTLPAYLDYIKNQSKSQKTIKWCYAGYATCIIRANGDVQPCYQLKAAGNLKEKSFKEIWNSKEMNEIRNKIKKGCGVCFANCIIEPSLIFSSLKAALQFYTLKWIKVK